MIWELTTIDNLLVAGHTLFLTNTFDNLFRTPRFYREERVMRRKAYEILLFLGIQDYAFRSPYGLPYGILKKIELARTLMTNPSLIILDEPAAGLNDIETIELAQTIKKISKEFNTTIFLVEHDMKLVMSICDTVCAISFGSLLDIGTPSQIQSSNLVRRAYLGDDEDE
jgi:branched-chain amino acid transport system ATP-binding protein